MSKLPDRDSFFMSKKRPDGMGLTLLYEDGVVYADMVIDGRFEGYKGVAHGGLVFGVLDVIMSYTMLLKARKIYMTRRAQMEFLKPVLCNTMYRAEARLKGFEGKDAMMSAWIQDAAGTRYAEVNAVFKEAKGLDMAELVNSFDFSGISPEIKEFFYSLIP